ncbi:molybdenum cofactor guanylyltransferase [Natronorubrum bangense]|uniref:Molybdopterin-guanine dinucleotide biosynthesis protein A n=2 Tax=Natronorubrum bangense TaxID=61858 RepID=L9WAQ2_9EURY|nr:molybdenum cofactor guanylyltransferase [Natronorubrum bangense]ELY46550.1 molybdopterin-guanine dinucleotide biosynthesis protein A [Natronorubrum bangense JCM 10635]QCC56552.1 molybdenum cofactor guanylyltransferase [Natronorubrum bangense]
MRAGLIVAGGQSRRFGKRDKAVADLAGIPMIRRVADRVVPVVDELVVNCQPDQVPAIEAALAGVEPEPTFAEDPKPDQGPMMGILTGLREVESEYAFVVACDMPFVEPSLAAFLFDRATGHDAAIPQPDEWLQTIQAVYRTHAMVRACETALARDRRGIIDALPELEYVTVDQAEILRHASLRTFENLNTSEAFDTAVERFQSIDTLEQH